MSLANKFHKVFEEVHKLIEVNQRDHNRRETICILVKKAVANSTYINTCKIELDTKFEDGIGPFDVAYLIKVLLRLNHHLEGVTIHVHDMKYVIFAVLVFYLLESSDKSDFEDLRTYFDNVFDLVEMNPASFNVVGKIKSSCVC